MATPCSSCEAAAAVARFLTIARPGQATVREKMSRFLAFALPVQTPEEARAVIADYTNRYHDARHVCWAYMTGAARSTFLSSDNGEPSGTAGRPILGQINSLELTNVVVVVVRYFGGIKLGTSGLIAAYRQAAREALEDAGTQPGREYTTLTLGFPYEATHAVMKVAKGEDVTVEEQAWDNMCSMRLRLPLDLEEEVRRRLSDIDGVTLYS